MILDEILAHKRREVAVALSARPMADVQARASDASPAKPFHTALRRTDGRMGLIAEVKKASPSAGIIRADFDPVAIARAYESADADCLSVLTDEHFFQGHLDYLIAIRTAVNLPLLRKDFVIDPYQIYEARAAGADAILLIVAALDLQQIVDYKALASQLGMDALVETHTADEMAVALEVGADLIGVNARNLQTFVTDLGIIEELAALTPPSATLVGESGIKTASDVARLAGAGVHAILVGETLMRADDIANAVRVLLGERNDGIAQARPLGGGGSPRRGLNRLRWVRAVDKDA